MQFSSGGNKNAAVCLGLLDDLERRGLDVGKDYLFVLDGSKALRSAVARKFGIYRINGEQQVACLRRERGRQAGKLDGDGGGCLE